MTFSFTRKIEWVGEWVSSPHILADDSCGLFGFRLIALARSAIHRAAGFCHCLLFLMEASQKVSFFVLFMKGVSQGPKDLAAKTVSRDKCIFIFSFLYLFVFCLAFFADMVGVIHSVQ